MGSLSYYNPAFLLVGILYMCVNMHMKAVETLVTTSAESL